MEMRGEYVEGASNPVRRVTIGENGELVEG
jgi:hypothetical protein